jgi:predicted membrane-bound spermidine synthase
MIDQTPAVPGPKNTSLAEIVVIIVFFASGISALIYQVVWQRLLTLICGVGAVTCAWIVSMFLAGLGLGAILGGWLGKRFDSPAMLYAGIESIVGLFGIFSFSVLETLSQSNAHAGVRYFLATLFLGVPTTLMGSTLPLITKIYNNRVRDFGLSVSQLYCVNTLGAALGSILASYILISLFGMQVALNAAAILNFSLAAAFFLISNRLRDVRKQTVAVFSAPRITYAKSIRLAVFLTGFIAIGYEIIWFRFIGIFLKSDAYAFSTVLAVYLSGIAIGSQFGNYFCRSTRHPLWNVFCWIQLLIGVYVALSVLGFYYCSDYYPLKDLCALTTGWNHQAQGNKAWVYFLADMDVLLWPSVFVFIPTILMGLSFPVAAVLARQDETEDANAVGRIYFLTVLGNVAGGLVTGLLLLPLIGTEHTLQLFILVALAFGLLNAAEFRYRSISMMVVLVLMGAIPFFPKSGALYEPLLPRPKSNEHLYLQEGREGIVATYLGPNDAVLNLINGWVHGGRPGYPAFFDAIQTLSHARVADRVLLIGYGTGASADAILKDPRVKNLVVVEINHALMRNLTKITLFRKLLAEPRIDFRYGDARHFLVCSREQFDVIAMAPLRSKEPLSNNLYSRQFFQLVKNHLRPGGIFFAWSDEPAIVPATLSVVFKHILMYRSFTLASSKPIRNNERLERQLFNSYSEMERRHIKEAAKTVYLVEAKASKFPNLKLINEDWRPLCEYYRRPGIFWLSEHAPAIVRRALPDLARYTDAVDQNTPDSEGIDIAFAKSGFWDESRTPNRRTCPPGGCR